MRLSTFAENLNVRARVRGVIKSVAPPILLSAIRWVGVQVGRSQSKRPVWEHVPEGWARREADPYIKGWNVPAIRDWHRQRLETWSQSFEAPRPLGSSEYSADPTTQHLYSHNVHVSFAYVLALAARGRDDISILDWGGGIGQYYLLSRAVLPEVTLSYHCRDVPLVCEVGRELIQDVTFYEDESCLDRNYDLVVASNSLQYSEDWPGVLGRLAEAATGLLYVAQVPIVLGPDSFVAVQRPYAHGFDTEYLGWIFKRDTLLTTAAALGLKPVREFFFDNPVEIRGTSEPAVHRGFLFEQSS